MRSTKIICTYGPAIDNKDMIVKMIASGMNITRFNFSHGDYEYHKRGMDLIKELREELNVPIAILMDTKGPEIRTGSEQSSEWIELPTGGKINLTTEESTNTPDSIYVDYEKFAEKISIGAHILIDDGKCEVVVDNKSENQINCSIIRGGKVKGKRSINVPGAALDIPFLSKKDKNDLKFGAEQQVDIVAASFTRNSDDIKSIRNYLFGNNRFTCDIVAKIENHEGVENIESICLAADGIMIARGDLGVELPVEDVPKIQKSIINLSRKIGKPVITATQMLETMVDNQHPTRAEVSDIANAIYDSSSAIMLSGETASGKYPVECVNMMNSIASKTEEEIPHTIPGFSTDSQMVAEETTKAISSAALTLSQQIMSDAIIILTSSGFSARTVASLNPSMPIIAATRYERTYYKMALYRGVHPLLIDFETNSLGDLFNHTLEVIEEKKLLKKGALVTMLGGAPLGISGSTNVLRVGSIGKVAVRGKGIHPGSSKGRVHLFKNPENIPSDCILVMRYLQEGDLHVLSQCSGLVIQSEQGEEMAKIAGATLNIPILTCAEGAYNVLFDNELVTLDSSAGIIYRS